MLHSHPHVTHQPYVEVRYLTSDCLIQHVDFCCNQNITFTQSYFIYICLLILQPRSMGYIVLLLENKSCCDTSSLMDPITFMSTNTAFFYNRDKAFYGKKTEFYLDSRMRPWKSCLLLSVYTADGAKVTPLCATKIFDKRFYKLISNVNIQPSQFIQNKSPLYVQNKLSYQNTHFVLLLTKPPLLRRKL